MIIKCDNCNKEFNKRPSLVNKNKHNFCSIKCRNDFLNNDIEIKCDFCGENFLVCASQVKNKKHIFCSKECRYSWDKEHFTKENNPNYKNGMIITKCINYDCTFEIPHYRKDTTKYCSRNCKDEYLKNVISQQKEYKEFHKKIGIKTQQNMKNKFTKPESLVKDFLEQNSIEYIPQHSMYDRFVVDFYLPKNNIVIEVLGDYWHGNPNKYGYSDNKKPLTEKQIHNQRRDEIRYEYLTNKNHLVYMIWETDIYKNINEQLNFLII